MSNSQRDAIDYRYLLIEYYKKLRLTENELSVILMIEHLLQQKNTLITPDLLSMKMNLDVKEIDKIFVVLIERGLLVFDTGKKIKVSLKPLYKKLLDTFTQEMVEDDEAKNDKEKAEAISSVKEAFEKEYKRSLSPLENSLIDDWIAHGYPAERIIDAMKECLSKGKRTFKSIDKLLLQWQARDDIEKTGVSATSDKWDKNIEETLKIAKAKWIDD
jgi:DNA replication protein